MNHIDSLVWLLVIIFMIHDSEEIIMAEVWGKRYKKRISMVWPPDKLPYGLNFANGFQTASVTIGVMCEFLMLSAICFLCVLFQNYVIWYGSFVGFFIHLLAPHLTGFMKFKKYTPGILTGAIVFLPAIWILYKAESILHYGILTIVLSTLFMHGFNTFLVFKVLHKRMTPCSEWLQKYSQAEDDESPEKGV